MTKMFDEAVVQKVVSELKAVGIKMLDGLASDELENIERLLGAKLPPDLRLFLSYAVPVDSDEGVKFPRWKTDPAQSIIKSQESVEVAFLTDIEHNNYWNEKLFGKKPVAIEEAKEQCLSVLHTWPPLVRVYAHRYIPTGPSESGNPVFSVWQAVDTIYYGLDLTDYFAQEFKIKSPLPPPSKPKQIPYWTEAFGLQD